MFRKRKLTYKQVVPTDNLKFKIGDLVRSTENFWPSAGAETKEIVRIDPYKTYAYSRIWYVTKGPSGFGGFANSAEASYELV